MGLESISIRLDPCCATRMQNLLAKPRSFKPNAKARLPRRAPIAAVLAIAFISAANSEAQTSSFGRVYDPPPQIIPAPPFRPQPPLWKRDRQYAVPEPQRRREIRFYPGTDNPTWKGAYPGNTKPTGPGAAKKRPGITRQRIIVPHRSATVKIIPNKTSDKKSANSLCEG